MIWFDIQQLETGLKNRTLSEKQIFYYLLANLILFSVVPYIATNNNQNNWLIAFEILIIITITIIGTKKTFDINSAGDNKDYYERFLSLSFVVGIRFIVLVLVLMIPFYIIEDLVAKNISVNKDLTGLSDILFAVVGEVLYYYMLTKSFKRVSQ